MSERKASYLNIQKNRLTMKYMSSVVEKETTEQVPDGSHVEAVCAPQSLSGLRTESVRDRVTDRREIGILLSSNTKGGRSRESVKKLG